MAQSLPINPLRRFYRPMEARDPEEAHRAATPLELLFDLCFVAAVAIAAESLHHALTGDHISEGIVRYCMVFFAIWWAWLNFTWFASAYDTDDLPYRLITLVQIVGVLVLAAGLPRAFDSGDFSIVIAGYIIMRIAMVVQWLRAARSDPARRRTALRYALGLAVTQFAWLSLLVIPEEALPFVFFALVVVELLVPMWAERAASTTWHPYHIVERYGLFTLIVLGESIISTTRAFQVALDEGQDEVRLISLAVAAIVIVFSMWSIYFERAEHQSGGSSATTFIWGYGHWFIFAAIAANGSGLAAAIDFETHHSSLTAVETGFAVAAPVAVYLISVWGIRLRKFGAVSAGYVLPVGAILCLLAPFTGQGTYVVAAILVGSVVLNAVLINRRGVASQSSELSHGM